MIRIDNSSPLSGTLRGGILALGNFDGFHRGHQAVVGEALRQARTDGRPVIVGTFDPHPVRYFRPDSDPFQLSSLDQRAEFLAAAGVDAMLVFHFNDALANTTAQEWVAQELHTKLGVAGVVTGQDFTFGKGRGGNPHALQELGAPYGISATAVSGVMDDDTAVSSSRIRKALRAGDCQAATHLLTRPYTIRGTVQHGDKLGRTIGFPTANLAMAEYVRPAYGIYAVTGTLPDGRVLKGAANLGIRPSFDPPKELLEPHFFDFSEDLYGQDIDISFHQYLRPEAKFDDLDALTAQIAADCDQARTLLDALPA